MDQKKIGDFLKVLRKEKGITQEEFAEVMGVSGRTVSRWETGSNMPDLDIIIQIADYYDVEIKELLDGERKSEIMNKEVEETVLKVADYTNHAKQKLTKQIFWFFVIGLAAFTVYIAMEFMDLDATPVIDFVRGFALGIAYGIMILGVLYTSGIMLKLMNLKKKAIGRL